MRKHLGFILFFAAVLAVFLWKVIILKAGFIYGDYASQFYPWSLIYSEALKLGEFPYWTRYFQCGFPLMAEGQVGGFYPLNIVFFACLPFRFAYNYIVVLHFALAGVFTYIYTRKLGACQWGGALAAFLFCFGSAYAGCYLNTATLKILAWLPAVLWLFEKYFRERKARYLLIAGPIFGMQLLAGQTQVAFYCIFAYAAYFIYGLNLKGNGGLRGKDLLVAAAGMLIAAIIYLPQFFIAAKISALSWRGPETSWQFLLSDSFSPLNFASIVFPYPVFFGMRFYVGVVSILFLIMSFYGLKKYPQHRPLFFVLVLSIFWAFGKYNLLFVPLAKLICLAKLQPLLGFRNHSKILLLGLFAASVLSGLGFTGFFAASWDSPRRRAAKVFSIFIASMLGLFFAARAALGIFGERIIEFGDWYVTNHVYGKAFHRFDLSEYTDKVRSLYDILVQNSSVINPFVLISLILCVAALLMVRNLMARWETHQPYYKYALFGLIFLDLFTFSFYGTGFRGNILDYSSIEPEKKQVYEAIKDDDMELFRILPYDIASAKLPNWAMPSMNAACGMDSVALYTPLVNEYYRKALGELEVVDNALGLKSPEPDALDKNLDLVRMLNVKYVVSPERLDKPFLVPVTDEEGTYLYKVTGHLPRAFIARELIPEMIDPSVRVDIVTYRSGEALFRVDMPYEGFFVFSENRYPGWDAYVDGEKAEILQFSVIQAVRLSPGKHEVWFGFRPFRR